MKISSRYIYIALVAVPVLWADSQPMPCSVRAIASIIPALSILRRPLPGIRNI